MHFRASAEVFQPADAGLIRVRLWVEPFFNTAFADSDLAIFEVLLRYTPIVMLGMRERYPARSKVRKKERIYDCAPQLDYIVFVDGPFEDQLGEYLRGIALSAPHLAKLGASKEQIAAFEAILESAVERILLERPDQTRY